MDASSTGFGAVTTPVYTRSVGGRDRKGANEESAKTEAGVAADLATMKASTDAKLIAATQNPSAQAAGRRTDVVEFSTALDLRLGQEMLQSAIGRKLDALFEKHGVDLDAHAGQDMSVEATGKRIFDFAVGMFEIYKQQHSELDEEQVKSKFETEIRKAVKDGYESAIDVLKGMQVSEEVLGISMQTYDAVDKLFEEFFHPKEEDEEDVDAGDSAKSTQRSANGQGHEHATISDFA